MGCSCTVMAKPTHSSMIPSDTREREAMKKVLGSPHQAIYKSSSVYPEFEEDGADTPVVTWKIVPTVDEARKKFEEDGSLVKNSDISHLEFRMLLEETKGQQIIGKIAKERKALDIFMCWVDIQEFKSIPTEDYRRSKALHLYHKYIKSGSVLELGGITEDEKIRYKDTLDRSKIEKDLLTIDFYVNLQQICFLEMYHNIYLPFKSTDQYLRLSKHVKSRYNNVKLDDFEYYGKLGEGGFGMVVHCCKKSTGKHYAMKIQTKKGLLETYSDDPHRVDYEKQALASCQHPFIINLDYAFQSETLAIMVIGLASSGDLSKVLLRQPDERLSEDRVRFYIAEVVLALNHLHQMGLIYRDLKPNNILLTESGHIQLVDLGGVVDESGNVLGRREDDNLKHLPLFQTNSTLVNSNIETIKHRGKHKHPKRRLSIMGTFGYMAPEMVIMLHQRRAEKRGYWNAVDWWSLGVTMFKLLTGSRPFTEDKFQAFLDLASTVHLRPELRCNSVEYAILFQDIIFPPYISYEAQDLIRGLLDVNEQSRLGAGENGVKRIKEHPFFQSINWELLEQKHVEPPIKPESTIIPHQEPYSSFEDMMLTLDKGKWLSDQLPRHDDQRFFQRWDFISPHTIRIESGLANEMEQYDRNFKIRQLIGEVDSTRRSKAVLS